ncbi:hypothetical protein [Streptacidiphilus jiangxiensis]|uniref:Uncharacterized protein n=1 Tax=Streptacidiphilus jiangxiensis TaxID=235985 RepID=A0A1H7IB38_STRJI|nr:hypothetical protein [Streptacidiphilus jiangxiensis]SEK59763.1 hypothetical protein SAMN05414137_102583 [Streptacidiphilus jiangxiensis]
MDRTFSGPFEAHVTVGCEAEAEHARLDAWAARAGLKLTHIVLARGRTPSQPMLTLRGRGALDEQLAAVRSVTAALEEDGFTVLRVKLEVSARADGVPVLDDVDARLHMAAGRYFEHHVCLLLEPGADLGSLAELVTPHRAHLSWNARRIGADGLERRFVTQRCHGVGRGTAGARLDALLVSLRQAGHRWAEVEREFVVHDSDAGVDAGWIDDADEGDESERVPERPRRVEAAVVRR